ncbi:glycoside hydrolase family 93 protein [Paraphaeosphaeria sporulosa]|uniref:Glycoside hydrolase family 93 protein n=1 Tax=Paraphaeosphaeria sporulosa TaxID=1460663 RepID=A0A177C556_9PLEO|nr:glycoside hydrolase family 93 protein [Paraphaeosphaeria sporulosa]OAG02291.1 glycoside hydrolase family 93 protein [Paraphaeosphaeria sporulosa]
MKIASILSVLALASSAVAKPLAAKAPATFAQRVVFEPPRNANWTDPGVLYARSAQLPNGDLLATWENYSPEPPKVYFPIYKSTDNGYTWKELSRVQDTQNGWGLRYQPFLYVLPEALGGFPAGTVLVSGSSIPTDLSKTQIELYASRDSGETWKFVSHIAAGGVAVPNNGETPVWEPFLYKHKDTLICYYSDQRDAKYGQKMVHQTTKDLKTWGPVVDDVTYPTYTDRPGMPTIAKLPNGQFIMTYEYGGNHGTTSYSFPVHYKIVSDPEKFGAATGVQLKATDGTAPSGSPYVVWSSVGGKNGTIIASGHSNSEIFINTQLGQGAWKKVATPELTHYTRHLRVLKDQTKLVIMGGGQLPPSSTNKVQLSVMDISKL